MDSIDWDKDSDWEEFESFLAKPNPPTVSRVVASSSQDARLPLEFESLLDWVVQDFSQDPRLPPLRYNTYMQYPSA